MIKIRAKTPFLRPVFLVLFGVGITEISNAIVKQMSSLYLWNEILFYNRIAGFIPVFIWLYLRRRSIPNYTNHWKLIVIHSPLGFFAAGGYYFALKYIDLQTASLVSLSAPLFIVLLSALFLKERLSVQKIAAVLIGFSGAWLVLGPQGSGNLTPLLFLALGCHVFPLAVGPLIMRYLGLRNIDPGVLHLYGLVIQLMMLTPLFFFQHSALQVEHIPVLMSVGILEMIGVLMVTLAYWYAPASELAPWHYSRIAWAIILSVLIWGIVPDLNGMIGTALIVGSGLWLICGQSQSKNKPRTPKEQDLCR